MTSHIMNETHLANNRIPSRERTPHEHTFILALEAPIESLRGRIESRGYSPRLKEREVVVGSEGEEVVVEREGEEDKEGRITKLEQEIVKMRNDHQEVLEVQIRQTRAAEERLKRTKELLASKSVELSGAHAFLSATDRLSEVEVLGLARNLNEMVYQVAVNLTDGWEKVRLSRDVNRMSNDLATRTRVPSLVQMVISRDPAGLTFLLQSCLCLQVAEITSSWGQYQESEILGSIYKRLSASG